MFSENGTQYGDVQNSLPNLRKFQNWPGDLGDDFGDLAFLKKKVIFGGLQSDRKNQGPPKNGQKILMRPHLAPPGRALSGRKGPCGPRGKRSVKKFDFQRNLN